MFKVGDKVVGNSGMLIQENVGRFATVTEVWDDRIGVRWDTCPTHQRPKHELLDSRKFNPVPKKSDNSVEGIGKEIISTLAARGKQYDKDGTKERSMAKTVEAFNAITGQDLTPVQGWAFMQVLKQVRFFSNTTEPHRDSLIDNGAYALLQAEEALSV